MNDFLSRICFYIFFAISNFHDKRPEGMLLQKKNTTFTYIIIVRKRSRRANVP